MALDNNIDVLTLTETWMKKEDSAICSEIREVSFNVLHTPRGRRGGGVATLTKRNISMRKVNVQRKFRSFECQEVLLKPPANCRILVVYRPGTVGQFNSFLEEFEDLLVSLTEQRHCSVICGDLNIHMERSSDPHTIRFKTLLSELGWENAVEVPTHNRGGTLDLILTKADESSTAAVRISEVSVTPHPAAPDHFLVTCLADLPSPNTDQYMIRSGRNINGIDRELLKEEILCSDLCDDLPDQLEEYVDLYNNTLGSVLDNLAPTEEKKVKIRTVPKWMKTATCLRVRRIRRAKERRWKSRLLKSCNIRVLTSVYTEWKEASKVSIKTLEDARSKYYQAEFKRLQGNAKGMYSVVNGLLGIEKSPTTLPSDKEPSQLAPEFNEYFKSKVTKIYQQIESQSIPPPAVTPQPDKPTTKFTAFSPVSDEDLLKMIREMNRKHCQLDPMPTSLIMECLPELLPSISKIVNDSLLTGIFPQSFKEAIIRPSFKGKELDPEDLSSYRPVSNLSFISKVVEKAVSIQLVDYLENNGLFPSHQSAYRKFHSCETATLKIVNDLLVLLDSRSRAVLLLLDLSAAFDTVKHSRLLRKLEDQYGISGNALKWFQSYLQSRSTSVLLENNRSDTLEVEIGVPQGSILGPVLFVLYTRDLQDIARVYDLNIHLFADDTQIYVSFDESNTDDVFRRLQRCFKHIQWWMGENFLKLNPSKTEVLVLTNKADKSPIPETLSLDPDEEDFKVAETARNLGIWFDSKLSMSEHISRTVRACWAQLSNLWRIGSRLTRQTKIQLVHTLIHSRLDYGNALLKQATKEDINRLQKVQNSAVRFINNHKRRRGVTKLRRELHFLPVNARIDFKILLLTYKCINGLAPPYLRDLITPRKQTGHNLRKDNDPTLLEKTFSSKYRHTRAAFSLNAPKLWNGLPRGIRESSTVEMFKTRLKTHLFRLAYE